VTTADRGRSTESKPSEGGGRLWLRRLIAISIALVVAVLGYFIAAAFIPRWWAQRVAHQVDSRFTLGVAWGLVYGGVFTFAAVLVALQARRQIFDWPVKIGLIVLGLLLEIPNFMTLGIVLGTSRAAHAGERILDVEAPAFRSASLAGVIIGALLALGVFILVSLVRTRGRQVKALQAEAKQRALDKKADAEASTQAARDAESQGHSG
jgi:Kef-type K+ transport system membrane component KefB